jgi:hypothetical protein
MVQVRGNTITAGSATVYLNASIAEGGSVVVNQGAPGSNANAWPVLAIAPIAYDYSTTKNDGSAGRFNATTISFTGPALTSQQLCRVVVIPSAGAQALVWDQGVNATLTIAANTITIYPWNGNASPTGPLGSIVDVYWTAQDKEVSPPFTQSSEYGDATIAYTSGTTLTLTAANGNSLPATGQVVEVVVITSTGARVRYVSGNGCYVTMLAGVLTLAGCQATPFTTGGSADLGYIVRWNAYPKATLRGGTKGATTPVDATVRSVGANVNSLDTFDNAPTQAIYNYSTARGDGSVVWATNTTLTWTGPTIVSGQLCRVRVVIDAGTKPLVWEQGRNADLTISGTTITVATFDGTTVPLPAGAANYEVMWAGPDKQVSPEFAHSSEYGDATVAYASATTLTLTAGINGVALPTSAQLVQVVVDHLPGGTPSGRTIYTNGNGCWMAMAGGVLTLYGSQATPFVNTDVFTVRWNAAPTIAVTTVATQDGDYSTDKGDATAVRAGPTTITFTGPTIAANQLRTVTVYDVTGAVYAYYQQGRNGVLLTIAAGVITIAGAGSTPIPANALVGVTWVAQNKAFNAGLQSNDVSPRFSDRSYRTSTTPVALIASAQTITGSSVALGPQFAVDGEKWLRAFLSWTKGDGNCTTIQVQAFFSHTPGGVLFPLQVLKVDTSAVPYVVTAGKEIVNISALNQTDVGTFMWDLGNSVGYVQFNVLAGTPGTTMAMATAEYTMGY